MKAKVNIESNFTKTIIERVFDESEYMLKHDAILKTTAKKFSVSISTVWRDMREKLPLINPTQYKAIDNLIYKDKTGNIRIYLKEE